MATTDVNVLVELGQLGDAARALVTALNKQRQPIIDKTNYKKDDVDLCVTEAGSVATDADALSSELKTASAVTADIVRRIRECYREASKCAHDADGMVKGLHAGRSKDAAAAEAIAKVVQLLFEAVAKLAVKLDRASEAVGPLEVIAEVRQLHETYKNVEGQRDIYEQRSRAELKNSLVDIADHIASFAAPPATPAARAGTALISSQPQRAEDALQQLLGTALVPRGKPPTAEFATALSAALDQRVAIDGRNVRILQPGLTVSSSGSEQPRGSHASLMRDIETESRAFLAIVNELPAIRRNVDAAAVGDHRKQIARHLEELGTTVRLPGGPLIARAKFQLEAIEGEWKALKAELLPSEAGVKRSLANVENEEVQSEAARGDRTLERMKNALSDWQTGPDSSQGAGIARLMQQVQALEENTRQLEHAFDQAELGRSDRLSRRFGTPPVPIQALIDWLAEDSRGWANDLAKGDARSTVLEAIKSGAEQQRKLLGQLENDVRDLVTVGRARVRRAVGEITENLQAVQAEVDQLNPKALSTT